MLRKRIVSMIVATVATAGVAGALPLVTAAPAEARIIPNRCEYTSAEPLLVYAPNTYKIAVKQMQCELNFSLEYTKVDVDGYFGSQTMAAVETFQDCAGLALVDGKVGPKTWLALNGWSGSDDFLPC